MDTIYKYSKKIDSFFKSPTLKLAIPTFFNDPFESTISREISTLIDCDDPEVTEIDFEMEVARIGVVSFSETSRNLLMWAHYADEHRGMCIGFSSDVLSSLDTSNEYIERYHSFSPKKVNYDNLRVDLKELQQDPDFIYETAISRTLTTKSDEWIYEKEHRCIVPIGWSDKAILTENNEKAIQALKRYHNSDAKIDSETGEVIAKDKSLTFETLCFYKGMLFLKKINPKSVKCIYLGYRYGDKAALSLADELKNPSHPLNHIELFKYRLSKNRFELEPIMLHPSHTDYSRPHTT